MQLNPHKLWVFIGWQTEYILTLSENFFTLTEAIRNHGPGPWFSFPQNKNSIPFDVDRACNTLVFKNWTYFFMIFLF